jgi:hypothetical protein
MKKLLAEDNDMIQAISADRTDEPFAKVTERRSADPGYDQGSKTPDEGMPVRAIAISRPATEFSAANVVAPKSDTVRETKSS